MKDIFQAVSLKQECCTLCCDLTVFKQLNKRIININECKNYTTPLLFVKENTGMMQTVKLPNVSSTIGKLDQSNYRN